jgi:hypothetical protein
MSSSSLFVVAYTVAMQIDGGSYMHDFAVRQFGLCRPVFGQGLHVPAFSLLSQPPFLNSARLPGHSGTCFQARVDT